MGRRSARAAAAAKRAWAEALCRVAPTETRRITPSYERGKDNPEAPQQWVCNRKKAYPGEDIARRAADALNAKNRTDEARPGYFGTTVTPYLCRRCGRWHLGR